MMFRILRLAFRAVDVQRCCGLGVTVRWSPRHSSLQCKAFYFSFTNLLLVLACTSDECGLHGVASLYGIRIFIPDLQSRPTIFGSKIESSLPLYYLNSEAISYNRSRSPPFSRKKNADLVHFTKRFTHHHTTQTYWPFTRYLTEIL